MLTNNNSKWVQSTGTSARSAQDILRDLRRAPITRFQLGCIAVGICLNMLDGFDVLVMAFTASSVSAEWHLNGSQLGLLLSVGLMGMAGGSLVIAPLADRYGRRNVIIAGVVICTVGMLLSAFTTNQYQLLALRALTGLGIGTVLPTVNVLISEYAPERWRNTFIVVYTAGYPIGASVGGAIAALLIVHWQWRAAFFFGGCCSAVILPIAMKMLPESIEYLLVKRPARALDRVNRLLVRLGQPLLADIPEPAVVQVKQQSAARRLLDPDNVRKLALICLAFFTVMGTLYFVNSWTPKLLSAEGMPLSQAIASGVLFNVGGVVGAIGVGVLCARYDVRRLTAVFILFAVVALFLISQCLYWSTAVLILVTVVGASINGAIGGLYAIAASIFVTETRGTGMGWALGVGRLGALLSPLLVGMLVDLRWTSAHLFQLFTIPMILALLAFVGLRTKDVVV